MGIRFKLILPLIITLFVMFYVIHFFLKPSWLMQEYEEYVEMNNAMLDTLSTNLINNLLTADYSLMQDQLDAELKLKTEHWKAIVVQLEDGDQIYPLETVTQYPHTEAQYPHHEYIEKITRRLVNGGEPLGTVTLYANRSREVLLINERITQIEIILLVCFLFLLLFVLTIQSMLICTPLEKLKNAASALTLGDYDIELPPAGKDEIGKLSHSFKVMRKSIKTNEEALILAAHESVIAERLLQENQENLLDEHAAAVQALAETETVNEQLKQIHNEVAHLRSALDEHAIVSITDIEGNMTFINEKFCKISGYTAEELLGNHHRMLKSDFHVPEYYKELRDTVSNGEVWHGDVCSTAKNGKQYWVEATVVPFLDENNVPFKYVTISTDITEKINTLERLKTKTDEINQAHVDLKKSHQQALQSEKLASVGQLASGIAHEINTPVQFIGDNTRFLQEVFVDLHSLIHIYQELGEAVTTGTAYEDLLTKAAKLSEEMELDYLAEEIPQAIAQNLEGIERVSKIVLSMKDFSHPGSDHKEFVDINHAIQSTITVSRNEWKYNAELNTDFDERMTSVPCHLGEFNQVILNIIINASHAIKDARQDDKMGTISISTRQEEDFAEIRISDTGSGIPESIKKKIFEPFFTTKGVGKGTGQGLAIAYSVIVEKHGGSLDVDSAPGKGTTFIIHLPMNKTTNHEQIVAGSFEEELNLVKVI